MDPTKALMGSFKTMEIYEKLGDWLIPALIAAAIYQLQKIASEIKEIHKSLAIFGTRVEEHARRIERIEEEVYRRGNES